ncbi:MAG: hypothetical protein FWH29_06900 [Methanobrevibacter sp.]|nr:hypothetical protein [Methanobrevibacter sp.]
MIKKEIKQYKRGKTGYVQRIDFNKQDNLKESQIVYILTEKELKNINQTNNKELERMQNQNIKYVTQLEEKDNEISKINKELVEIVTSKDNTLLEKDKIITDLTKQLNKAIDDKNIYKDTIAGLHILIGKYKNRNIIERLMNKKPTLDKDDTKLITDRKK